MHLHNCHNITQRCPRLQELSSAQDYSYVQYNKTSRKKRKSRTVMILIDGNPLRMKNNPMNHCNLDVLVGQKAGQNLTRSLRINKCLKDGEILLHLLWQNWLETRLLCLHFSPTTNLYWKLQGLGWLLQLWRLIPDHPWSRDPREPRHTPRFHHLSAAIKTRC